MATGDFINDAVDLLGRIHENTQSAEEKEWLAAAADALQFIWATGQTYPFEDYRKSRELDAPALVVGAFKTREEADAWLANNPNPPAMAYVLIADEYHLVGYRRESNWREFLPHPTLEFHIEEMMREGLPPPVATFSTREEADAWLQEQSEPPAQSIIKVDGEYYLAVYYRNINHRALFSFSLVERYKERKKKRPGA